MVERWDHRLKGRRVNQPGEIMDVTARISQFVAEIHFDQIPPQALETAKIALLDTLGVALAGSREDSAKICAEIVRQEQARHEAVVIGQGFKSSALQAALANGTAVHALDFDYSISRGGQPAAAIVPALFALGEPLKCRRASTTGSLHRRV